jgi:hypothetical protein
MSRTLRDGQSLRRSVRVDGQLETTKALGLTILPSVLARADRVTTQRVAPRAHGIERRG